MNSSTNQLTRKKILHLITGLGVGGAEMNLVRLLPSLEELHDNVVCSLMGEGPTSKFLRNENIRVYQLSAQRRVVDFFHPTVLRQFHSLIQKEKPDIIITYLIHADLFGRFWGKVFGTPKVYCWNRGSLLQWQWLFLFDRLSRFLVDGYIFQTKAMRDEIITMQHIPLERTAVIPNALEKPTTPTREKNEIRTSLDISDNSAPVLLTISNLRQGKGHPTLFRAFEKVLKIFPNAHLFIAGDGEQRPILETFRAHSKKPQVIHFLGYRTDIPNLLRAADIFILPTFYEGMSNALLEAMLAGCPVVTTNIPVNREIIQEGKTGLLVPIKDSSALTQAILSLLQNKELYQSISQQGASFVERLCSPKTIAQAISTFIDTKHP